MEKTKFLPYLVKRVVFWLITLAMIVGLAVAVRTYKINKALPRFFGCYVVNISD